MKQAGIILTVLVLTLSVLTGCGCRNSKPAQTSEPTTLPTMTTAPTTQATTEPSTMATEPSVDATIEDGNGPISTDSTEETQNANTRSIPGGTGSGNGITGSITGSTR